MKNKIILILLLFCFGICQLIAQEQCLTNAWKSYNSGKYKDAIKYADQCINDFENEALEIQKKLDSQKITPGNGTVSDAEKNKIFKNGLLNDVATACFVKGESALALYNQNRKGNISYKKIATDAYQLTCKYNKGRCWDTRGWFWSPCKSASGKLPIK